jgi:hypothetical protein
VYSTGRLHTDGSTRLLVRGEGLACREAFSWASNPGLPPVAVKTGSPTAPSAPTATHTHCAWLASPQVHTGPHSMHCSQERAGRALDGLLRAEQYRLMVLLARARAQEVKPQSYPATKFCPVSMYGGFSS